MSKMKTLVVAAIAGAALAGGIAGYALAAQPHMHAALDSLQKAKAELSVAYHDKGGHRLKALADVEDAIHETRLGMDAGD